MSTAAARAWVADFAVSLRSNAFTALAPARVTTAARALARASRRVSADLIGLPGGQYRSRLKRSAEAVFPRSVFAPENVHKTGFGGVTDSFVIADADTGGAVQSDPPSSPNDTASAPNSPRVDLEKVVIVVLLRAAGHPGFSTMTRRTS